jgi:predicted RND superfamily exporter protein
MTTFILKYRWWIISFFILLGAAMGSLIPFSKTDPDIRNYIPATMPSRCKTDSIEKVFGVQDMVVIIFSDKCILAPDDLLQIKEIDHDISRLNGVSDRISPFTVRSIKGSDGMLIAEKLIRRIPEDSSGINALRDDILADRFARDIAVSSDMTASSVSATISNRIPETETLRRIDSVISVHPGRTDIFKGGLPYIRKYLMKDVRKDGFVLIPSALLIMLLILKLTLGEWKSVLMPFSVVVLSTLICLGLIPLLGWKMSVLTLLVPIILVAVANNYGIYLVARYQELSVSEPGLSSNKMLRELLGSLNMPILFSGLTTVAGMLGLLTHNVIPARHVGILAAAGVTMALVMSLLLIPSLISLRKPQAAFISTKKPGTAHITRILDKYSSFLVRSPGKILIISAIITLLISAGIFRVRIDTNQEDLFPADHPVRRASEVINKKFGGSQTISVMISGDIKSPAVMKSIDSLTHSVERMNGVGNVFAISQVVREMSKAIFSPGEDGYDKIPSSREAIAQMFELYNMSGEQGDFRQLMNIDNTRANITIRLSDPANTVIRNVRSGLEDLTRNFPARVTVGGYAIIMADFAGSLIKGQVTSLAFALVAVFILLAIIFRSLKGGLIASIPLAASIMILFGIMGISGIALDAATALLSSIMIGVGVDFTIQYLWCFNIQIMNGMNAPEATRTAIRTIGRSIIINGFSVMAGFSALILSGFTSIRFFGYLVLISIGSCLIGALVVIPAFVLWFRPEFILRDMKRNGIRYLVQNRDAVA